MKEQNDCLAAAGIMSFTLLFYLPKNHLRKICKAWPPHVPVMSSRINLSHFRSQAVKIFFRPFRKASYLVS